MLENPVAAVADAPVDALLHGALVEEVADLNFRPAVDHPMRCFTPVKFQGRSKLISQPQVCRLRPSDRESRREWPKWAGGDLQPALPSLRSGRRTGRSSQAGAADGQGEVKSMAGATTGSRR